MRVIGRRFHIYASKGAATAKAVWSRDLTMPAPPDALPPWMIELAGQVGMIEPGALALLPRGVIVGSAVVEKCIEVRDQKSEVSKGASLTSDLRPLTSIYAWHLAGVERAQRPASPRRCPGPSGSIPSDSRDAAAALTGSASGVTLLRLVHRI
jgi:hypothetical protein